MSSLGLTQQLGHFKFHDPVLACLFLFFNLQKLLVDEFLSALLKTSQQTSMCVRIERETGVCVCLNARECERERVCLRERERERYFLLGLSALPPAATAVHTNATERGKKE